MTRHEIVDLIKKGWEGKGYASGQYHNAEGLGGRLKNATCVCAIGAASLALGLEFASEFSEAAHMHYDWWNDITSISDSAFSKGAAIENLEKWAERDA